MPGYWAEAELALQALGNQGLDQVVATGRTGCIRDRPADCDRAAKVSHRITPQTLYC